MIPYICPKCNKQTTFEDYNVNEWRCDEHYVFWVTTYRGMINIDFPNFYTSDIYIFPKSNNSQDYISKGQFTIDEILDRAYNNTLQNIINFI